MAYCIEAGKRYLLGSTDKSLQNLGIMFEITTLKGKDGGPQAVALFYDIDMAKTIFNTLERPLSAMF